MKTKIFMVVLFRSLKFKLLVTLGFFAMGT